MAKNLFRTLFYQHLRGAAAAKIRQPVIAVLDPQSQPARAAHAEVYGRPLKPGQGDYLEPGGLMVTWSVADTTRALRAYGGLGGRAAANWLEAPPVEPDFWQLLLGENKFTLAALPKDGPPLQSSAYYHTLPFELCDCCAHEEGPVRLSSRLKGGKQLEVHGSTMAVAAKAAWLTEMVAGCCLPSLSLDKLTGRQLDLPIKDAELVIVLRDFFADAPQAVAEAIRALRRARIKEHRWLTQTLEAYQELHPLADRVRAESAAPPSTGSGRAARLHRTFRGSRRV